MEDMAPKNEFVTKKDLEQLLQYKFGPSVQLESFTAVPLTDPGENYGSNILAVDVILKKDRKKLQTVVKLVPESEFLRTYFQCGLTVRKEMDMYLLVSPEYEKIQKENGIPTDQFLDVFPACYGARATKHEDVGQPADEGSAIVLENLKVSGYECGERTEGFDLEHTKYILHKLARFHATAIAIKLKKPEVFEKTVKKACSHMQAEFPPGLLSDNSYLESTERLLKMIPGCEKYTQRLTEVIRKQVKLIQSGEIPVPEEPFATISHNDFWTNNMMVTYDGAPGKKTPTGFKIVDYQVTTYASPVKDLIFFLYTSTRAGLVQEHYDEFVRLYHKSFVEWLNNLGCDEAPFAFEKFRGEIEREAPGELNHIFFMLRPSHLRRDNAKELAGVNQDAVNFSDESSFAESFYVKVKTLLDDFSRRGWM